MGASRFLYLSSQDFVFYGRETDTVSGALLVTGIMREHLHFALVSSSSTLPP